MIPLPEQRWLSVTIPDMHVSLFKQVYTIYIFKTQGQVKLF